MAHTLLKISSSKPLRLDSVRGKHVPLRRVVNKVMGILGGNDKSSNYAILNEEGSPSMSHAGAVCKMATGTGTVGVVINGTTVTVTWATSDTVAQGLLVTAINANSTVRLLGVRATQSVAVLTLASLSSTAVINICGIRFTATTDFSVAGTDNQDAAALAVAINANRDLQDKLVAIPDAAAGVCYLALMENRLPRSDEKVILESGTGLTVTSGFALAAYSAVFSRVPGAIANACTLTATGTNTTAHSAVSGKLGGGAGGAFASTSTFITSDMR